MWSCSENDSCGLMAFRQGIDKSEFTDLYGPNRGCPRPWVAEPTPATCMQPVEIPELAEEHIRRKAVSNKSVISDKFDILDKVDESIFLFDDFVIKFFHNETICENRVERGNKLGSLTPKILGSTKNFYKYEYSIGGLLADCVDVPLFN